MTRFLDTKSPIMLTIKMYHTMKGRIGQRNGEVHVQNRFFAVHAASLAIFSLIYSAQSYDPSNLVTDVFHGKQALKKVLSSW